MTGRMFLFFGDSYVNGTRDPEMLGWCGRLARRLAAEGQSVTHYNLGIRGETLVELSQRLPDELARRLRADLPPQVIVSAGTNDTSSDDGVRRVAEADSLSALRRIIATTRPHAPLLVVGPAALPDPEQSEANRTLSEGMASLCKAEDVPFIDIWTHTNAAEVWMRQCAEDDGFHPGAAGYEAVADAIWTAPAWRAFTATTEEAISTTSCGDGERARLSSSAIAQSLAPEAQGNTSATQIQVRPATEADHAGLHALLTESWLTFWAPHLPAEAEARFRAEDPVARFLDAALDRVQVAALGSRLVGAILVEDRCLEDLHVAVDMQGQGFGRRLLDHAVTLGARRLEVRGFNERAIRFYEHAGWERKRTYLATEMGFPTMTHEYTALQMAQKSIFKHGDGVDAALP